MNAMYMPLRIVSSIVAGLLARRIFALIWRMVDDGDPPSAEHRDVTIGKLALALTVEGALMALIRGLIDHGGRRLFTRFTGQWPGEEHPEPK